MFGLELRRKNNIANLYADIDGVLSKNGVKGSIVPEEVQSMAVAHGLQKMLGSDYFSICSIDQCAKVVGLSIPAERYRIYHANHCVHYSEMLPEFRAVLVAMVLDDFRHVLNPEKVVSKEVSL